MDNGVGPVPRASFLDAMAHMPGPVSIVTTGQGNQRKGLTVSAVCSLSADPPSIIACVNKSASAHDDLLKEGRFGVSVLRPGQEEIAALFTKKGVDRFASAEWIEIATGAPILKSALIGFDCRIAQSFDGYSHTILVGIVEGLVYSDDQNDECLVWHQRRYRVSAEI